MNRSLLKTAVLPLLGLMLTACASLSRSPASGYSASNFGRGSNESEIKLSSLAHAEQALEGRREREQYFTNKPYIKTNHERLEFLSLPTFYDRQKWLDTRGIRNGVQHHSVATQNLIDSGDIALGMTFQAVRSSWGEPEQIEAAGNPMYGNQRWYYTEQKSSSEGYLTQKRTVIFQEGRVAGWQSK